MEYSYGSFVFNIKFMKYLILLKENNTFDIPKGGKKDDEKPIDTAIREAKEETGLEIKPIPYFSVSYEYEKRHGKKIVTAFLSIVEDENIKISKEHAGFLWLSFDELLNDPRTYKNWLEILPKVNEYLTKFLAIKDLNDQYRMLPEKYEWDLSRNFVPGEGPLNARYMLIGQAPGREEDIKLRPFVGRSGRLLNKIIEEIGLKRSDFYITSVVQFFPFNNAVPSKRYIDLCKPFLIDQINIVKPKAIVLLGNIATTTLLGFDNVLINHGKIVEKDSIAYIVTIHPASALRFKKYYNILKEDLSLIKKF